MDEYEQEAEDFLEAHDLKFSATYTDSSCPPFCEDGQHIHGDKYRIRLWRKGAHGRSLTFSFWNSYMDSHEGREPTAYDVLASLSADAYCPDNFEEFCAEYGYDTDSRSAERMFTACDRFARRLRKFFTDEELDQLGEIN